MNSETFELPPSDSVLVIAPHNDDEVLGAGGIIQQYLKNDSTVKVVVVTNGDGQIRRPPLVPRGNFVKLGYKRQEESLNALDTLGLKEDDIIFLGYPDRGLNKLWSTHWSRDSLYTSTFTKTDHSPYSNSYTTGAPYCGTSLVKDLSQIIANLKPETIFIPHPNDSHSDHWATNAFGLYAQQIISNSTHKNPSVLTYLVHRGRWPVPKGKKLTSSLEPPRQLLDLDTDWAKIPLSLGERIVKFRAIAKYRSQTRLMRKYLFSFARANELFGIVPSLKFDSGLTFHNSFDLLSFLGREQRLEEDAVLSYLDPKQRSIMANIRRYNDIRSVDLYQSNGHLNIRVNLFNPVHPANDPRINIKPVCRLEKARENNFSYFFKWRDSQLFLNGKTDYPQSVKWEKGRKFFTLTLPLSSLENPEKILLGVELLRDNTPFARCAFRLVEL